jgi:regulator of protease activity HflC (stomatin/prohibitin superfamily)
MLLRFYSSQRLPFNKIIHFVPQQEAWVIERMGRFHKTLPAGLSILVPFIDRISYVHTLKEVALEVPHQSAITQGKINLKRQC